MTPHHWIRRLLGGLSSLLILGSLAWGDNWEDNVANPQTWTTGAAGIGTSAPANKLHVSGLGVSGGIRVEGSANTTQVRLFLENTHPDGGRTWLLQSTSGTAPAGQGNFSIRDAEAGQNRLVIDTNGNVGINSGNGPFFHALTVGGDASINLGSVETISDGGSWTLTANSDFEPDDDGTRDLGDPSRSWEDLFVTFPVSVISDARIKSDIQDAPYGLNEIMKLHSVSYLVRGQEERGRQLGLIAQEVQPIMNEVVMSKDYVRDEKTGQRRLVKTERLGINYSAIVPVLVRAIQEQQVMINQLAAGKQ